MKEAIEEDPLLEPWKKMQTHILCKSKPLVLIDTRDDIKKVHAVILPENKPLSVQED